jgi:hypothetical protein
LAVCGPSAGAAASPSALLELLPEGGDERRQRLAAGLFGLLRELRSQRRQGELLPQLLKSGRLECLPQRVECHPVPPVELREERLQGLLETVRRLSQVGAQDVQVADVTKFPAQPSQLILEVLGPGDVQQGLERA